MSRKTECQLARDGVFMLVESFARGFQATVKKSYDLGYDDAETAGVVNELENKVRSYREEVRGLNKKIGRDAAAHDARMNRIREGLANISAIFTKANAAGRMLSTVEEQTVFSFIKSLEKESAK